MRRPYCIRNPGQHGSILKFGDSGVQNRVDVI